MVLNNSLKGKFVVIEGLDGSGIETQAQILYNKLNNTSPAIYLDYPEYSLPIGELIERHLRGEVPLPTESSFLLNAADQIKDKQRINDALKNGENIVAARFSASNLAYQCARGLSLERALTILETLEMPVPDYAIFLNASPETSVKRKMAERRKEKSDLDTYERNLQFQQSVLRTYQKLIDEKIFAKEWIVVDGEKDIEEVAEEIERIILQKL